jgi:hypothetical protein
MSLSSTFISPWFCESIPVQVMVCCTHTKVISAPSSSVLISTQDMAGESRINYRNRMVLTAGRQTHLLALPMFYNLGIGSPDPRPSTSGIQLRLHVTIYDECDRRTFIR